MVAARTFPLIPVACLCLLSTGARLAASGGWYDDEPVHTLAGDLDRLPAKTLGEILLETMEAGKFEIAEITERSAVSDDEIKVVIGKIGTATPEALGAEMDKLVMKARLHYVLHGGVLNELYDIRDAMVADGPSAEERKQYCLTRLTHQFVPKNDIHPGTYAMGEPMRPHLLYLQGAMLYLLGAKDEARPWFEEIVKDFPQHPRAETAAFLAARCALAHSYSSNGQWDEAEQMFGDYLKIYPQGRYRADAHGWLGALLWRNKPAEALEHYIAQMEDPAHPECRKSAAHMVEFLLSKAVVHPERSEATLKVAVQHPRVALAAVYFVLNAPEIDPFDGKYDEPAELKRWKQAVLPRLATLVSAEERRYTGGWALRMRAMLAQAASGAGNQAAALKLTTVPEEDLKKSDDLLFARLLVLQRMKQPAEAVKMGKWLFENFPASPLRMGAAVRMATALMDDHRAGEAYLFLSRAEGENEKKPQGGNGGIYPESEEELQLQQSFVYPDTDGSDASRVLQYTILNFSPLRELENVLEDKAWAENPGGLGALMATLRERRAAHEDFVGALQLSTSESSRQFMVDFEKRVLAVKGATGEAKAQAMLALGDAFEEAAGRGNFGPMHFVTGELGQRADARALGIRDPDEELESYNLMRHATRWWLRAARTAPGTDLSIKARFKVLRAVKSIAMSSDYDFTRAIESNMGPASREIFNILQKEGPKSKEARTAAFWSFEPCPAPSPKSDDDRFHPSWSVMGQPDPEREADALSLLGGYRALHYDAFGLYGLMSDGNGAAELPQPPPPPPPKVINTPQAWEALPLPELAKVFEMTQRGVQATAEMPDVNFIEDVVLLGRMPGLSRDTRVSYIDFRMQADEDMGFAYERYHGPPPPKLAELLKEARANPALAPVQDFVDYVEIYKTEADRGDRPRGGDLRYPDYKEVEKACRKFLSKYPKSLRREACQLLLMRSLFRQLPDRYGHEGPGARHQHSVEDARPVVELDEPFHPEALVEAIAEYEKEFSNARYAAEVRNYKGIIAWREFDYGPALDLTVAQLDDVRHLDLQNEAAVRLANIFADLRSTRHREAVLAALKTRPAAAAKLKLYLDVASLHADHPLRCMRRYLGYQLGFE